MKNNAPSATVEELTGDKIGLVRFYAAGVEPSRQNRYSFAKVAVITGVNAFICGLLDCDITAKHLRAGAKALKPWGVTTLTWLHNGKLQTYRIRTRHG